ncbi:MAG: T9SS type A sorting domain-containing protein [Bacteroidia bacterium]|nr:T9SS type A sorting domain-containing protein [Bacteroidia bacterium]
MRLFFTLILSLALSFVFANFSGADPIDFHLTLNVYPNPSTTGDFSLEVSNLSPKDVVSIKVYNLIGKEVYHHQISSFTGDYKDTIRLGSLPKGIYLLEVVKGEKKQTRRLSFI